jgi:hypothetical protein
MKRRLTLGLLLVTLSTYAIEQKLMVSMDTPSTAWSVRIIEAYQSKDSIIVVAELKSGGIGGAAITRVTDTISIDAVKLPVKYYVLGKTWNWPNKGYTFFKDRKSLDKKLNAAKRIFTRKK